MQISFLLSKDLNFYAKYSAERQGQKSKEEKSRKPRQEKLSREENNLVNVAIRTAVAFYNIFMYLYNENILEYGQIAWNGLYNSRYWRSL